MANSSPDLDETRLIRKSEAQGEVPQDEALSKADEALCCCEYIDEDNSKLHLLQTFCDCVEVDEFVNSSLDEGTMNWDGFWQAVDAVDRRIRLPTWNGAQRVGLACPFALITALLLYIALSVNLIVSMTVLCILPTLVYCASKSIIRSFPQTSFFHYFGRTTIGIFVLCVITDTTISNYAIKCAITLFTCCIEYWVWTKLRGTIVNPKPSVAVLWRKCRCCDVMVADKDHHCVWLNCCINSANYKYFTAFVFFGCTGLLFSLICEMDLINPHMSGSILYRTCIAFVLIFMSIVMLISRYFKRSRDQ